MFFSSGHSQDCDYTSTQFFWSTPRLTKAGMGYGQVIPISLHIKHHNLYTEIWVLLLKTRACESELYLQRICVKNCQNCVHLWAYGSKDVRAKHAH